MKKKRIMYLVANLKKCGPINVLYNIVKFINKQIYDVYIVSLSPEGENPMEIKFKELNCKIYNLNLNRVSSIFYGVEKVSKLIIENDIDIIHSHGLRADIVNSKIKICRTISTLHNYPFDDYSMSYGKFIGYLIAKYHVRVLKKIDLVCACSKSVKLQMELRGIKTEYIKNGVDNNIFKPIAKYEKDKLREKLKLNKNDKIFIVVGVLRLLKNPYLIIDYFNSKNFSNEKLIFIGDGDLYKNCVARANENPNIIFIGKVDNVYEYLQVSDYYISASLSEGLPNSVLEAMSTGLPCILSNIPSHRELIYNKQQLFSPKSEEELAKAIQNVLQSDYQYLSNEARLIIENDLTTEKMTQNYESVYEKSFYN